MSRLFKIFHHIDSGTINQMFDHYSPIFVLTAGRSGSKFIHHVFSHCSDMRSYHEAFPTLQYYSNFAFQNQNEPNILNKMFEASRMELMLDAYNNEKIYAESNQCLVFFSKAILSTFKKAKFIHLVRHPGDFVRSAIMKGWHKNDSIWEAGRIRFKDAEAWQKLDQIEKLAWVWSETNKYISTFTNNCLHSNSLFVKLEKFVRDTNVFKDIISFSGSSATLNENEILEVQKTKVNALEIHQSEPLNMHKLSNYAKFDDWPEKDKQSVRNFVEPLSSQYGYVL